MTENLNINPQDRLSEFYRELEIIADSYKKAYRIPDKSELPSFIHNFRILSQEMEFELLDHLVSQLKSMDTLDEVTQSFVLKILKGELNVSNDRYDNLVELAKILTNRSSEQD